jgi:hypothetical protein
LNKTKEIILKKTKKKEDYVKEIRLDIRRKRNERLDYINCNNDHNHQIDKDKALTRQ